MRLYVVTDEDNLYGERVGDLAYETEKLIGLYIENELVVFDKVEVERIF